MKLNMKLNFLSVAFTASLLVSTAQAACSSPYYPVKEGFNRTYQTVSAGQTITYTETISKVSANGFTYTNSLSPGASSSFKCGPNGIVGSNQVMPPGMKVTAMRGVTQPPTLKLGTSWTTGMTMQGTVQGQDMETTVDTVMNVVGREKVTVKAGTFDALKVQGTVTVSLVMGGKKINQPPAQITSWLAEGVGMVKSSATNVTVELLKYSK